MTEKASAGSGFSRQDWFKFRIEDLMKFLEVHGRRPRRNCTDKHESSLASWVATQRSRVRRGEVAGDQLQALKTVLRLYDTVPSTAARNRAENLSAPARDIVRFHGTHGRLPSYLDPGEMPVYSQLRVIRRRLLDGVLSSPDKRALDAIPGVLKTVRQDPMKRLVELRKWCKTHQRLPRHSFWRKTTADEDIEAGLGQWMYRHVNRRHEPLETAETIHVRDSIITLQDTYPASGKVIEEVRAAAVVDFIEKNGRLPQVRREHELYQHAFRIRTRYRHGGAFRKATLRMLELTEGLPNHLESQWDTDYDRLAAFISSHGRLPVAVAKRGPGRPSTEHQLATWLSLQTGGDGMGDGPRRSRLAALISPHLVTDAIETPPAGMPNGRVA
ncbi:helicase associated domain-containing protein [Paenarthrobacter sp. C1]|uniref:helicase associated domain-containing protein n=1 Tax=Paenarthrobacter sp. C1 TaxID=3400220 RepID=UPI003BF48EE4